MPVALAAVEREPGADLLGDAPEVQFLRTARASRVFICQPTILVTLDHPPGMGATLTVTKGAIALPRLDQPGLEAAVRSLARRDRDLRDLVARHGPPPLWSRPPGFATLVRIILEQQVSLASARAVFHRVRGAAGGVSVPRVHALGYQGLRRAGLTRQKARYVAALAERIASGAIRLSSLSGASDAAARAELVRLHGVGEWTADIYLLMALRRPDIWPTGDLALVTALA